jgi:hypothetical protein
MKVYKQMKMYNDDELNLFVSEQEVNKIFWTIKVLRKLRKT